MLHEHMRSTREEIEYLLVDLQVLVQVQDKCSRSRETRTWSCTAFRWLTLGERSLLSHDQERERDAGERQMSCRRQD